MLTRPDPNAPKRGLSAYMFFANEQRENVREENPGISFGMFPSTLSTWLHLAQVLTPTQVKSERSSVSAGRP